MDEKKAKRRTAKPRAPRTMESSPAADGTGAESVRSPVPVEPAEKNSETLSGLAGEALAHKTMAGQEPFDDEWDDDEVFLPEEGEAEGDEERILCFSLGSEEYGVRLTDMREVLKYHEVTFVPGTPDYVLGIISLRGRVIPVVAPARRMGMGVPEVAGEEVRVLVFHCGGDPVGIRADRVTGVVRIDPAETLPPLSTLSDEQARFVEGVFRRGRRFVSLMSLDDLLQIELPTN